MPENKNQMQQREKLDIKDRKTQIVEALMAKPSLQQFNSNTHSKGDKPDFSSLQQFYKPDQNSSLSKVK